MTARLRFPARLPELLTDDRLLLTRFVESRDEAAFAAIVKRHGGLVLGVCRRATGNESLAEDAFQAAFLVLARDPGAAAKATSLAGWLFGIARRVSLAAKRNELRRCRRERQAARCESAGADTHEWDDLLRTVDEELDRIPEEDRSALIACFLREQTQDEAARELGWSLSTLRRRLERGKERLRNRLVRRGATLSAGLFAGLLAPSASSASVPRDLLAKAGRVEQSSPVALALAAKHAGVASTKKFALASLAAVVLVGTLAAMQNSGPVPIATSTPIVEAAAPVPAPSPDWAMLTGRVLFPEGRELPERREILKTDGSVKDAECCFADGRRLFHENVRIDLKTRAIANALVFLRPNLDAPNAPFPKEKIHAAFANSEPTEQVVEVVECQFSPRITVARSGDRLTFRNSAPLATNVRSEGVGNGPASKGGAMNVLLAAKTGSVTYPGPLQAAARGDKFVSDIHYWMKGYVWAFDHPYAAVTNDRGEFRIPNAPAGTWRLVIWHEEFGFSGGHRLGDAVKISPDSKGDMKLGSRTFEFK